MYSDLEPQKWGDPIAHDLVGSILRGSERQTDSDSLPRVPDDYLIDDPEIDRIAPFLIQDADASQHSALVDVMKGANLVVQGPPGTGKSQTITNIIANALAVGKRVLFLAEKQAALEVVKRRLDRAKLGDFCLELHSDKVSPKTVVASLASRYEIGSGFTSIPATQRIEPVDNFRVQPDVALALLIDPVLATDAAKRQGRGDRLEGGGVDREADHGW
jgi:hypothetical protein